MAGHVSGDGYTRLAEPALSVVPLLVLDSLATLTVTPPETVPLER
jgi:hypothetical protein